MAPDWGELALLVITPDAFRRGLGGRIIREVQALGLNTVSSRLVRPGSLELDALYEDVVANDGSWDTYRYRCVDQLFALGSSLTVVVERPPQLAIPEGLHAFLGHVKGSGPLHRADPSCLRRRLGSINSILSLLHTSASPAEAELDLRIFGRRNWLTSSKSAAPAAPGDLVVLDPQMAAQMLDSAVPETRDFDQVLIDVRCRILAHCWELLSPDHRVRAEGSISRHGRRAVLDQGLVNSCAQDIADRTERWVGEALSAAYRPHRPPLDTARLWLGLEALGVDTDPWERAVLTTSQYFSPMTDLPS